MRASAAKRAPSHDRKLREIQFRVQRGEKERDTWSHLQVQDFLVFKETQHKSGTYREALRGTQNILRRLERVTRKFLHSTGKLRNVTALPVPY